MPIIECGIGTIEYQEPSNLKLTHLMEQFKDNIELSDPDELLAYLDEYPNRKKGTGNDEEDEVKELEEEIETLEETINELEAELDEQKNIDCGIGSIDYKVDNLLLGQLMEELTDAIQSSTPLEVLRMLEQFTKQKIAA